MKEWIANLDKVDAEAEKTTLSELLQKFTNGRAGMSESTKATEPGIVKKLKENWGYGLDIRVSKIRPSMLDEWLAKAEPNLKASSYNRYTLFLKQLFDLAVADKMIAESPFPRLRKAGRKSRNPNGSSPPTNNSAP